MKSKFLIVLLLGVINAIIIGIFIKSQNFSNTTSLLKNILNYSNKDNIKVKEAQFNNKEVPINKKDEIYKDKVIENESNISKQNQKPLVKENKNIETGKEEKFNDKETLKQINNKKENNKTSSTMADLDISHINAGPIEVNCYIIGDPKSKKALVIDPGGGSDEILNILKEKGFELESIYLTHAHFDHMLGINGLRKATNAKIYLHEADLELYKMLPLQIKFFGYAGRYSSEETSLPDPEVFIKDGDHVKINGEDVATIIHTPGHSPGSVCFHFEKLNKLYSGDTLFRTSCGRTDLWQGSYEEIRKSIRGKLFTLDDKIEVYPGHGPSSSIGYEKTHNFSV